MMGSSSSPYSDQENSVFGEGKKINKGWLVLHNDFEDSINNKDVDDDDVVVTSILRELRLGEKQELKLSHDILRVNDQLQEDELVAMESIYGDNIRILDKKQALRSFQIHVDIESPREELTVSTGIHSSSGSNTKHADSTQSNSYSFKVQYLPPIVLTCVLPQSYPSHLPPYFTINVQWLDASRISDLCYMLDSIWKEQSGQEIVYQWVEWLESSSLSYLGFEEVIVIKPYGASRVEDKRAISGCVSPDVVIPAMKSYNDERCHENFRNDLHDCCICLNEYAGTEFIRLPCQHFFCTSCMKTYADMHVKEGTVIKLLCPEAKCGGLVPPGLLKRLLGDEEFERWESLMLQRTLDSMSDVAYCPRCETACIEDEGHDAWCSNCFFSFCTLCRERRHVGIACMTPEKKLLMLQERQNSTQVKGQQRRREQQMIFDILSVQAIFRDAKQCPSCKMAISRVEGCNKMICNNCGVYFCYRCNQVIEGYDHFSDGTCKLFTQMTQNSENLMNQRQIVNQISSQLQAQSHPCALCGQPNIKAGNNNHIFCWACQNHYCYLCRKMVKRSSNHFGPKGCKQHTAG